MLFDETRYRVLKSTEILQDCEAETKKLKPSSLLFRIVGRRVAGRSDVEAFGFAIAFSEILDSFTESRAELGQSTDAEDE